MIFLTKLVYIDLWTKLAYVCFKIHGRGSAYVWGFYCFFICLVLFWWGRESFDLLWTIFAIFVGFGEAPSGYGSRSNLSELVYFLYIIGEKIIRTVFRWISVFMLFMWTPKAYRINILVAIDASLNPAYLVLSNVIWKHFLFTCEMLERIL